MLYEIRYNLNLSYVHHSLYASIGLSSGLPTQNSFLQNNQSAHAGTSLLLFLNRPDFFYPDHLCSRIIQR